jgi:hypothetical protein
LGRRGLELPAALLVVALTQCGTSAVVPTGLAAATVQAALLPVSQTAARLTSAGLQTLGWNKLKALAAVILGVCLVGTGAGLLTHTARAQKPSEEATGLRQEDKPTPQKDVKPAPAQPARPASGEEMTVRGNVLSPEGKPVQGARIALLTRHGLILSGEEDWGFHRLEVGGQTTSDSAGHFGLNVRRLGPATVREVHVVATHPGHGLGWQRLNAAAGEANAEIRLVAEQRVTGRFVDLQGQGAAGVTVRVVRMTRQADKGQKEDSVQVPTGFPPATTRTDARGYFTFGGLGPNLRLELEVHDDRFQPFREFIVDTADRKACENIRQVLPPGNVVEGRVTYADTGKPAVHARIEVNTYSGKTDGGPFGGYVNCQTDENGRYRISIIPGTHGNVRVGPPPGQPYLDAMESFDWRRGTARREINLAMPPGVVVRGKITEAGSGKPIAGAYVECDRNWYSRAASGPDGVYQIGVPAGNHRLTVTGPTPDYIPVVIGSAGGTIGKPIGDPTYYHGVADLEVKAGEGPREVPFTLRRGVTLKGSLVGPDGKAVKDSLLFVGAYKHPHEKTLHPIRVRNSRWELPGCDPEKTYRLIFLEHPEPVTPWMMLEGSGSNGQLFTPDLVGPANKLGAVVEVSAARAGAESTRVQLAPCGSVKLRFVDASGKPLAGYRLWLQLLVTPGPAFRKAVEQKRAAPEVIRLADPHFPERVQVADAKGWITVQGLIPGATYRVKRAELDGEPLKDFTVEPGQILELDVVVK